MRIKSLSYEDPTGPGWTLDRLVFHDHLNLFVGASGSGKTRVLNILFNLGASAVRDKFSQGSWTIHFEQSGIEYTWSYEGVASGDDEGRVISEHLWLGTPDEHHSEIISRSEAELIYNGVKTPKLPENNSALYLLRNEDQLKSVHEAFSRIMRRRFWSEDLSEAVTLRPIPRRLISKLTQRPDKLVVWGSQSSLHVTLCLLEQFFRHDYDIICDHFRRVFPFVTDIRISTAAEALNLPLGADVPVVLLKERNVDRPVHLNEVSSGMQKVLLIITDIILSPPDVLYLIDEYENSLGVNAIDFLPPFLTECGGARQFVLTTHHPLLINSIPVRSWFIFHRHGLRIRVTQGTEIEERYGKSKQQRFIQLINDPLYTEGVK